MYNFIRGLTTSTAVILAFTLTFIIAGCQQKEKDKDIKEVQRLTFSGGPVGGTFKYFSNGIASRLSNALDHMEVFSLTSGGSIENIHKTNSSEADFGVAYSGDTFLAFNGLLPNDRKRYENALALAYLYSAPAHLIVLSDSDIKTVEDLAGKRVAIGGKGSGAATSALRYFTNAGLWDKIHPEFIGYSKAASALGKGEVNAMWALAGFPNTAIIQASAKNRIRMLETVDSGNKNGFFKKYPFYTEVTIPAGTYREIDYDVRTFQDAAIWIAGRHVSPETVYESLQTIFTPEGLNYLATVKSTARSMSLEKGLKDISTPIHEGAERFWKEKGLTITEEQMARLDKE